MGESFVGVVLAAADIATGRSRSPALVGAGFAPTATVLGLAVSALNLAAVSRLVSAR